MDRVTNTPFCVGVFLKAEKMKTLHDCKIKSIIDCAAAWEGMRDSTPQDCAEYILKNAGDQQIDSQQIIDAAKVLRKVARECESEYMAVVAKLLAS